MSLASAALAAPLAPGAVVAAHQQGASTPAAGTPIASPIASTPVDVETLLRLSQQLVGVDTLNPETASFLAQLIGGDSARVAGFEELAQLDDPTATDALSGLSNDASTVVQDILHFWYLGMFDGQPVEQRAEMFFSLPTWQTVPYFTQPTLCKSFGYWATEVPIEGE